MQLRESSLMGDRPLCPLDPSHKVHRHGGYKRYANCDDDQRDHIPRFLCFACGHTISVLPDHRLPYRPASVPLVEKHFDARARGAPDPPATLKETGCLGRAWVRLRQRAGRLAATLDPVGIFPARGASELWNHLRRVGNLAVILLHLARGFSISLLHDYRCLRPWFAGGA